MDRPDVAGTDCSDCSRFLYKQDDQGQWTPVLAGPRKIPLQVGRRPPCETCPKVPEERRLRAAEAGARLGPDSAVDVPAALRLYLAYWQAQAGTPLPDCDFTQKLFGYIHFLVKEQEFRNQASLSKIPALVRLLGMR